MLVSEVEVTVVIDVMVVIDVIDVMVVVVEVGDVLSGGSVVATESVAGGRLVVSPTSSPSVGSMNTGFMSRHPPFNTTQPTSHCRMPPGYQLSSAAWPGSRALPDRPRGLGERWPSPLLLPE